VCQCVRVYHVRCFACAASGHAHNPYGHGTESIFPPLHQPKKPHSLTHKEQIHPYSNKEEIYSYSYQERIFSHTQDTRRASLTHKTHEEQIYPHTNKEQIYSYTDKELMYYNTQHTQSADALSRLQQKICSDALTHTGRDSLKRTL